MKLLDHFEDLVKKVIARDNYISNETLSKEFRNASVIFHSQLGTFYGTGEPRFEYTVCILVNKGIQTVGVSRCSESDEWDTLIGRDIALVRALREYIAQRKVPSKGKEK